MNFMDLQRCFSVLDFSLPWRFGRLLSTLRWKGDTDARGEPDFFAVDGFHSQAGLRRVCGALPRQLSRARFLLPRPVSRDGLRPVDLSRESAGHRNVFERRAAEAVPRWLSRQGLQK